MAELATSARKVLDMLAASGQPTLDQLPPPMARQGADMGLVMLQGEEESVAEVRDLKAPGPGGDIPMRLYRPAGSTPEQALPVLLYFHGGGFVIGSLPLYDRMCRALANAAGCAVVSVDYRLAPETRFPGAVEDCIAATRWVAEQAGALKLDASRLAVGGDSAGGNLATVVALHARDNGGPAIRYQLLIYPVADARGGRPSHEENAQGYFLTADLMGYFLGHYLGDNPPVNDWRVSPLLASDHSGLPPASVLVCGFDPLRDDGIAYADALRKAGVPVRFTHLEDQIHGCFNMDGAIPEARAALRLLGGELREGLA